MGPAPMQSCRYNIIGYAESELNTNPKAIAFAFHLADAFGDQVGLFVLESWMERVGPLSYADASRVQASIDDLDSLLKSCMRSSDEMVIASSLEPLEELSTGVLRTLASGICDKSVCLGFFLLEVPPGELSKELFDASLQELGFSFINDW